MRARPLIIVASVTVGYVGVFVLLQPHIGDAVFSLATIPIAVCAWLYGVRIGLPAAAGYVAINLALMQTVGGEHGFRPSQIPRILVALMLAAAVGWLADLTRRQRKLLQEKKRIANELRASRQGLERAVEERTSELVHANQALSSEIAARREAEARAATADRMAVVGMLTAGIGHEINNPLAVIVANLDYISESIPGDDPQLVGAVADALSAALRAAEIIQHMRVFIQSSTTSEHAHVKRVVDSTLHMVANELRHRARVDVEVADTQPVALSTAQLGQVLLNLLVNGSQALPQGPAKGNVIAIKVTSRGRTRVRIDVTDTGHGIPADVVPRIFDPFFTTKPVGQGTGLGLWVCHQIVTAAGGTIDVQSKVGAGTTFRVELPVAIDAEDEPAIASTVRVITRVRLLVIDDDPAIGRSIKRQLGKRHEVVVHDNAPRALAEIEAGGYFDVILCDLMMPAMNGVEFFSRLQAVAPQLSDRVIFMSGGAFTQQTIDFMHHPSRHSIDKPFETAKLESAIQEVIDARVLH